MGDEGPPFKAIGTEESRLSSSGAREHGTKARWTKRIKESRARYRMYQVKRRIFQR